MKLKVLGALCSGLLLAATSAAYADYTIVNHTGENLLLQPAKHGFKNCKKYEPIPHPGYFISLGEYASTHKIVGLGQTGRQCQQAFNVYESPNTKRFLGTVTIYTHDTDGFVDQQIRISKGSSLEGRVSKDGGTVTISH